MSREIHIYSSLSVRSLESRKMEFMKRFTVPDNMEFSRVFEADQRHNSIVISASGRDIGVRSQILLIVRKKNGFLDVSALAPTIEKLIDTIGAENCVALSDNETVFPS